MTVYAVFRGLVDMDGKEFRGVFSTMEGAIQYAMRSAGDHVIEVHEVDHDPLVQRDYTQDRWIMVL